MSKNPRKQKAKAQKQSTFGQLGGETSAPSFAQSTIGDVSSLGATSSSFGQIESSLCGLSIGGDQREEPFNFTEKKYGTRGTKVKLQANFFKIELNKNTPNYFHYNIDIKKAEDKKNAPRKDATPKSKKTPKHLNNLIFAELFRKNKSVFQTSILPAFDGEKNMYSLSRFNIQGIWKGEVNIKDGEKTEKFIVEVTTPEISHDQSLTTLGSRNLPINPIELQALDIIMRNGPRLTKIQLGYNFFLKDSDPNARKNQFEIGRDVLKYGQFGHYQCSKIAEKGLYYNVDRAMAVFTYGGSMQEAIDAILGQRGSLSDRRSKSQVEEQLKGLKFRLLHLNYNRNAIFGSFSSESVSRQRFNIEENGTKKQITVKEYYEKTYKEFCRRRPINPNNPCVQVGGRSNAKYYPIEVCELLSDEVYRRKLKPDLQGMVTRKSSQQTPFDRFQGIEHHVRTLKQDSVVKIDGTPIDYLEKFGINIDPKPAIVEGRILNAPMLEYAGGKEISTQNRGQWEMKGCKFLNASKIENKWGVINISKVNGYDNRSSLRKNHIEELIQKLIAESRKNGVVLSNPEFVDYSFEYRGKGSLKNDLIESAARKNLKLLIICIPNQDEIYNEIKTISEIGYGLITQCLRQDNKYWNDSRGLSNQLIVNLFLKINPKTNGTNHKLSKNVPKLLQEKVPPMIMGLDVTHPSPTDGLNKSIAACIGSYTNEFDKCFSKIIIQEKARKEIVDLQKVTTYLLDNFAKHNKAYPNSIIVYRDGIGEGDFQKVINTEMASIQKAAEAKNVNVKITYIMVQKRHNTRFLPVASKPTDKSAFQNTAPGTVVDRDIVHHRFFEFFLCSHAGMMGTSRPTKYVVLHDDNNLDADNIQAITYYLCYLYPRCTKASSIPPHVAYAHLMAKRGRAYLAHLDDSDRQSSMSGDKLEKLSQSQIDQYNANIAVKETINGRLFFI